VAIKVNSEHLDQIRKHGEKTYPHECCGFLLGTFENSVNVLHEVYPADNEWNVSINEVQTLGESIPAASGSYAPARSESHANRYWITAEQYKDADRYADSKKLQIIGYYHSHPDHPAQPSGYDFDHSCFANQSYLIVAIDKGRAADLNSFAKPDYTQFEPEEILVEDC
jgi:proteasome lid subunit RPN8/RPN11